MGKKFKNYKEEEKILKMEIEKTKLEIEKAKLELEKQSEDFRKILIENYIECANETILYYKELIGNLNPKYAILIKKEDDEDGKNVSK